MQQRDSLDPLDFMMSHLDDNATVAVEEGEFGINFRKIPDVLLRYAQWKIKDNKEKLVERVLLNYNYLHFAYTSMSQFGFEPNEKYYQSIKEMAQRDRPYEEIDCAVYGLAKFKKPEDIKLIAHILYENKWQLGRYSFMLMEKYPDSTYLSILDIYAKTYFSRHFNFHEGETPAIEFFSALASYKRKETAELLPILLNRISRLGCYNDTNYLKMSLFQAFLKNKCEAYSSILPQIEMGLEKTLNKMKAQYSR
jgi:hypothetical protein